MAALVCEICGGKLMAKSGGLFECEYCGMQYDKTRIQEMVQEIKGTVQVEGTVEVKGTVKLEGPVKLEGGVTLENLLKRGKDALADCAWSQANKHYEKALDIDPQNAQAYLGKLMAAYKVTSQNKLKDCNKPLSLNNNFQKAISFADPTLTCWGLRSAALPARAWSFLATRRPESWRRLVRRQCFRGRRNWRRTY